MKKTIRPRSMPQLFGKSSYLGGAAIISAGGFISKILGALYRIPLTNLLGSHGMGVYQMVFPLYCILLTVSASGIPSGIARLVSSRKACLIAGGETESAERAALRLYGAIGAVGALLMCLAAKPLAALQGEAAVEQCCKALSPAVFFVSVLSVIRGYFQGKGNMLPTAVTEVSEQAVKVMAGCALAYINRGDPAKAVASTLAAVTLSELSSAYMAWLFYKKRGAPKPLYRLKQASYKSILAYTLPLTITAIAMPLSQLAESILAVKLMRVTQGDATALYGVFSGCAVTIVNLPASVTYGLAAASIPHVSPSAARGDMQRAKAQCAKCLMLTFVVALPCAAALYIFAPLAARVIFRSLSEAHAALLVTLVRVMAVTAVTQSLVQTSSALLTSLGKPAKAAATQWFTAVFRVALSLALIKFTALSVTSLAVSADCAYLLAVLLNICYIITVKNKAGGKNENHADRFRITGRRT